MIGKILKKINICLSWVIEVVCLVSITVAGYFLLDSYFVERSASADSFIANYKKECINEETGEFSLAKLQEMNPDIVGWVQINDNPIDYPVLQGDPEFTYLNRDAEGHTSLTGSLYIGAKANRYFEDGYTIIYGHHMEGGAMLGSLDYFEDETYLSDHRHGTLISEKATFDIEILALCQTDAYYKSFYFGSDTETFLSCAKDKENMILLAGTLTDIKPTDKLLIFSTCSSNGTTDRLLLITRLTTI